MHLDVPINAYQFEYDLSSSDLLTIPLPVVRFDPVHCFTISEYTITDAQTGADASDYIFVSIELSLIIVQTNDLGLLGKREYYIHAYNAARTSKYIDNFVVSYIDSCQ